MLIDPKGFALVRAMFNDFWSGCDDKPAAFVDRLDQAEPYLNERLTRVWRVLAARRQHTENAELAAAIKFTQGGKRRSTPLRTEARLDRRVPGALWQVLCGDWFEFCYRRSQSSWKVHVGVLAAHTGEVSDPQVFRNQGEFIRNFKGHFSK